MLSNIEELAASFIGRTESVSDEVSATIARRLAVTLDQSPDGLETGAPLPDGWHVILFTPMAPTRALVQDGHSPQGDFLPDLPLPRRMFAGRRVIFHQPLRLGDPVERVSTITKIEPKDGRSGMLAFVTIVHGINSPAGLCVTEEQTLVYREEASGPARKVEPENAPTDWPWTSSFTPTPPLLVRYSAITFNGHRIHYDQTYAREIEGYKERVVNGGLTAIHMIEFAKTLKSQPMKEFQVRNQRPLFVNETVLLLGRPSAEDDLRTDFWAADAEGYVSSKSSILWGNST
ncbi:MAG: 3-methylfumaryl-CoA hydratase [Gammaproteobacteria bacterium]|jgi:3-methylfumaryl-CoA hydratase